MVLSPPYLVVPVLVLAALAAGCSGRAGTGTIGRPPSVPDSPTPPAAAAPPEAPAVAQVPVATDDPRCALIPAAEDPVQSVGIAHPIDPKRAPRPANDGERLLFRQLYETLIRIDCTGAVQPGLATTWTQDAAGVWTFRLRDDARFADGSAVTAKDIVAGWSREDMTEALRPEALRHIHAAVAPDDRTLVITPRHGAGGTPALLAHPDLAIAKPVPGTAWPLGTRGRIVSDDTQAGDRGRRTIAVAPNVDAGAGAQAGLRFIVAPPAGDPRDLLDARVDLFVTDSPAAIDYAATLEAYEVRPLEWHRTYVFVSRTRGVDADPLPAGARDELAADAVRGAARGAQEPFWVDRLTACEAPRLAGDRTPGPIRSDRVVYEQGDAAARDLAARLVALAGARGPAATSPLTSPLPDAIRGTLRRAAGLAGTALDVSLRAGQDPGYVIAVEREPIDPCAAFELLGSRMPWLEVRHIVPLVETRRHAIVRTGRDGVRIEYDTVILGSMPGSIPGSDLGSAVGSVDGSR